MVTVVKYPNSSESGLGKKRWGRLSLVSVVSPEGRPGLDSWIGEGENPEIFSLPTTTLTVVFTQYVVQAIITRREGGGGRLLYEQGVKRSTLLKKYNGLQQVQRVTNKSKYDEK